MELRKDFAYSLVVPTSMGVRITPANSQPVHSSDTFILQATSAETNVASISSYLGLPVKVLTKFVKDSPIAAFIKSSCRALCPVAQPSGREGPAESRKTADALSYQPVLG